MVAFDLESLFQSRRFYDSMLLPQVLERAKQNRNYNEIGDVSDN